MFWWENWEQHAYWIMLYRPRFWQRELWLTCMIHMPQFRVLYTGKEKNSGFWVYEGVIVSGTFQQVAVCFKNTDFPSTSPVAINEFSQFI